MDHQGIFAFFAEQQAKPHGKQDSNTPIPLYFNVNRDRLWSA